MDLPDNIKHIYICEPIQTNKQIICEKEKKMRIETHTWGVTQYELSHAIQLNIIHIILFNLNNNVPKTEIKDKHVLMFTTHIKTKISSYKQQDIIKKKLDETLFVNLYTVIQLLNECNLQCHYCSSDIYILYEIVREMKQWTLDRIDNDKGHNTDNLVIACLECNLKRKRTNKDKFMFTKNMKISREGIN
jgi:5-methylcytosine-specific restriction endonuclease McrA